MPYNPPKMTDAPTPTRRFRPTPAWLIFGLLAVEGLLWLSERCRWFWFNERKGWTVLIAVAVVGVAMLVMLLWFLVPLVFRWRFQFSIRSLLVLAGVVAIPCSWLGMEMRAAEKQREAVDEITKLRGDVTYDWQVYANGYTLQRQPPGPAWLRNLLGEDFFAVVIVVSLHHTEATDATLEHLKRLAQLKRLMLGDTNVTNAGLAHLAGLNQLQWLSLNKTEVTDAGLSHLQCSTQLQILDLDSRHVTDAGVAKLHNALPNCDILH